MAAIHRLLAQRSFNVQRRGLSAEMIMSIKFAAVIIETDDGKLVQRPLTPEESTFILYMLKEDEKLKVFPCEGVEFRKGAISKSKGSSQETS